MVGGHYLSRQAILFFICSTARRWRQKPMRKRHRWGESLKKSKLIRKDSLLFFLKRSAHPYGDHESHVQNTCKNDPGHDQKKSTYTVIIKLTGFGGLCIICLSGYKRSQNQIKLNIFRAFRSKGMFHGRWAWAMPTGLSGKRLGLPLWKENGR